MIFKNFLVVIFTLFLSFSLLSQNQIELEWNNVKYNGVEVISFDKSVYLNQYNGLPSFQKNTQISEEFYYDINIVNITYIPVTESEKLKLNQIKVPEQISYSSELLKSSDNYFNRILIFPYIKNGNEYQKIQTFTLEETSEKTIKKSRKKSEKINSVLQNGSWYKISVSENAVYKLTLSDLQSLGINTTNLSVSSIRLYGNGGGMLPRLNSDYRDEDLQENAIEIIDNNNNGIFEVGDLILFYGQNVSQWTPYNNFIGKFNHHKHLYDDFNYYFITINSSGNAKRIKNYVSSLKNAEQKSFDVFNDLQYHELDLTNFIQSGEQWYGEEFDVELTQSFNFNVPNINGNTAVYIKSNVAARASSTPSFSYSRNGNQFMNVSLGTVSYGYADDFATIASVEGQTNPSQDNFNIDITFNRNSSSYKGWLNSLELCAFRKLKFDGGQMNFRKRIGDGSDIEWYGIIENATINNRVWNVTNSIDVSIHQLLDYDTVSVSFYYDHFAGGSDEKFVVFDGADYKIPNLIGSVSNQDLHGETDFEMLIISHPDFTSAAQKLSDFHFNKDGSKCKIVTPQEVFNEFSSGKQDISSIRDYCKYLYDLPNTTFKYLLIIGDASYDPKDRIANNTNFVITYQSNNSYSPLNTFSTDDYFGYLDENEGLLLNDLVDIGIGRLPSKTLEEANVMVDKIIHYHDLSSRGSWRNVSSFIADDGDNSDGNIHMQQADNLCNIIDDNYNIYNFEKLYLDIYNQISTPVGPRSPDCRDAITRRVDKGALLVNYTGHGGELGLTKERIIEVDQILEWDNYDHLPLFVTATCEFGRFDNPELTSGGEHIILSPKGGGVALLTTTRYVYSHLNYSLNTHFINSLFEKVDGKYPTLGDVFLNTKALSGTSINSNKFTLLGDPMMCLAYPTYGVKTTLSPDTISALGKVTFNGEIINSDSVKLNSFNGEIGVIVFDKELISKTQGQQSSTPMSYRDQTNIIYKGTSSVENGEFSFSFIVPKDIDYNLDNGRISYYAIEETENLDASGWFEDFIVGGVSSDIVADDLGPTIQLYMNDKQFVSGGLTNSTPVFLAFVQDSSGVNTVGNGIGHDITITLDNESSKKIILNDYYESEKDSYQKGKVEYALNELESGLHTIDFKIWDVFNNSSEETIEFFVSETEDFVIQHLLNYPNPFTTNTSFYFEHNRSNQNLEVQIQVFTVSGKLVKTIHSLEVNTGFRVGPISWNGKDDFQDKIGRGTYIYKLSVKDENGDFVQKLEKLVILN